MNRNRATVSAVAVTLLTVGLAVGPAAAVPAAEAKARVGADWATQSIVFTAAAGQTNNLNIFSMYTSDGIRRIGFSDVVPLEPGDHCAYSRPEDTTSVVCELPADSSRPDRIDVFLGDGNDTLDGEKAATTSSAAAPERTPSKADPAATSSSRSRSSHIGGMPFTSGIRAWLS